MLRDTSVTATIDDATVECMCACHESDTCTHWTWDVKNLMCGLQVNILDSVYRELRIDCFEVNTNTTTRTICDILISATNDDVTVECMCACQEPDSFAFWTLDVKNQMCELNEYTFEEVAKVSVTSGALRGIRSDVLPRTVLPAALPNRKPMRNPSKTPSRAPAEGTTMDPTVTPTSAATAHAVPSDYLESDMNTTLPKGLPQQVWVLRR